MIHRAFPKRMADSEMEGPDITNFLVGSRNKILRICALNIINTVFDYIINIYKVQLCRTLERV